MRVLWIFSWAAAAALLALSSIASPDAMRFEHFTSDDGLSQMNVLEIFQDHTGFLWFATQDGLDRFDGAEFRHVPNLASPIWQASDGALWANDRGTGLARLDLATATRESFGRDDGLSNGPVLAILGDGTGDGAWVGTQSGLDYLDASTRRFTQIYPDSGKADAVYDAVLSGDALIFITADRVRRRNADGSLEVVANSEDTLGELRKLLIDRKGALWIGGTGGLDRLDLGTGERRAYRHGTEQELTLGPGPVSSLLEDHEGALWVGTMQSGLFRLDPPSRHFVAVGRPEGSRGALPTLAVSSLFEDRSNLLWVGLAPGGVHVTDPSAGKFEHFQHTDETTSLSSNVVLAFEDAPDGTLWVGTWFTGLSRLDAKTGHFTHFRHDPEDRRGLTSDRIHALEFSPSGDLWVATRDAGLNRLNIESGVFEHFRHDPEDPQSLSHDRTMHLIHDPEGEMWVATNSGLNRFEPETGTFEHFRHDPEDPSSLSHDRAQHLFVHGQTLWISTWGGGVNRLDLRTGKIVERIQHDPLDPDSLAHNVVRSVFVDSAGRLWVATNGHGLDMKPPDRDGFVHFRAGDGLVNNVVQGVLEDDLGRLWIPTNGGLSRYDPRLDAWRTFDAKDGLQHAEFNFGAFHEDSKGRFFVGGIQGFNIFDPADFTRVARPPETVLTGFEGLGYDIKLERQPPFLRELNLGHRQNAFSFGFAGLDFYRQDHIRYRYRLEPFDQNWIHAGPRRFASYTNLPPGDYELQVRAVGTHGVWSEEKTLLRLRIATPPWLTPWAYSFYILLLGGSIFGYVHWQRLEVEKQREINQRLREVDRIKDEFLANTSHELRTPLFGITGLAESLIDGVHGPLPAAINEDLAMISTSGHRLARLVNDLLDFSTLERGRLVIHPRPVDLHTLADVVLTLSKPLVHNDAVALRNAVPHELQAALADEERLQQILHNLVGNAVKFTTEGHVEISARRVGEQVEITVADTGIGIAPEHQERIFHAFEQAEASIERSYGGTGLGLAVARGLVEAHGSSLHLSSTTGEGSRFFFCLPLTELSASPIPQQRARPSLAASITPPAPGPVRATRSTPGAQLGEHDDQRAHLLVVDDETVNLRVLSNLLSAANYRVSTVTNGPDAIEKLQHSAFDLVLLDVMMPKMSGYEVCRSLRRHLGVEELPVIFLTAKTQEADLVAGFSEGGNDYLIKPVTKAELLARVSVHLRVLEAYRQQRAEAKVLSGMLPICSSCKKIRDDDGYWNQLETFIQEHSEASLTHGLCPNCLDDIVAELDD